MLTADRIQLVPPPEITACEFCQVTYRPGLQFVAFDNGADADIPAGLTQTVEHQSRFLAYRARGLGIGDEPTTVIVRKPQCCSECLAHAARLLGFHDTAPLSAELDQARAELDDLRGQLEQSEEQRIEAESALRGTAVYERMLNAGKPAAGGTGKAKSAHDSDRPKRKG